MWNAKAPCNDRIYLNRKLWTKEFRKKYEKTSWEAYIKWWETSDHGRGCENMHYKRGYIIWAPKKISHGEQNILFGRLNNFFGPLIKLFGA